MKKLNSQSGRSMVEMLGVLAIIGVLSVGGIAGYSLSMRRHRANQVVDAISKYSAISYGTCQQKVLNGEMSLSECNSGANLPTYQNTDLGALPAGVVGMRHGRVDHNEETGVDTTVTGITFSDEKLCQAVASITGAYCWKTMDNNFGSDIYLKQN